jgi:excisionase family DNA binding protein
MVSNGNVDKRLLNPREAAQYLGLKVDTIYKKARLRELPSVKVGRCLRFDRNALDRLIEQHTIETIDRKEIASADLQGRRGSIQNSLETRR